MERKEQYAKLWQMDSNELYSNNLYDWMEENISRYKNILEIGCGAGFSTLKLLEKKHNVISIEFNDHCIKMTKKLLNMNGYNNINVIKYKISESNCMNLLKKIKSKLDVVICWNPGGIEDYGKSEKKSLLKYWIW